MSTLSGVFPNAITPTFAASEDPANQSRLRRENETAVFKPVEETEATVKARPTEIGQPGRLEAEQALEAANSKEPAAGRQPGNAQESEELQEVTAREQQEARQTAQEEQKLEKDLEIIRELAARDREVRSHEQAHQAVGGQYAGAMEFTYKQGPDGKRYAVGGEVAIDVSKVPGDPQATLEKADRVRRAALAPAEPSTQDRQVAALATQIGIEAQAELRQVERQEAEKAAEERAEQRAINEEGSEKVEANKEEDSDKTERVAADNEERLSEILQRTTETVESALDAAYRRQPQQEIGFNLDTTV